MQQIKPYWLKIHKALHSHASHVELGGRDWPIKIGNNGCRYIRCNDKDLGIVTIMEQNPNKGSSYAERARKGEALSWVMPSSGKWILIDEPIVKEITL